MHHRFVSPILLVSILVAVACGGTTQSSHEPPVDAQGGEAGSDPSGVGGGDTDGAGGSELGVGGAESTGGSGVGGSDVTGGGTGGGIGGHTVTGGGTGGGTGGNTLTGGGTGGNTVTGGGTGGGTGGSTITGGGTGGVVGLGGAAGEPGTGGTGGVVTIPLCEMAPDPGTCTEDIPMYYFDPSTGRCEEFSYSGCDGNDNRFETAATCRSSCGGEPPALCELPQEVGPCYAAMPRYWFNEDTGQCDLFSYGGCDGNANNFASEADCLRTCGSGPQPGCPVAQPTGECSATGMQCRYDYYSLCLCTSTDPYICDPVLDCLSPGGAGGASGSEGGSGATGSGAAGGASAGAVPPAPSEGGASGVDLPEPCYDGACDPVAPPTAVFCDCDATGTWVCNWGWM